MSVLDSFMIHRCTVQRGAATAGDYGHSPYTYTTPAATTTSVPCRLMIMTARERMAMGAAGTVISDYALHVPRASLPATMLVLGAETSHRVTSVTDRAGTSVDAGPFEVDRILPSAGGDQGHVILHLRRVA